jgi:hypothetical protein
MIVNQTSALLIGLSLCLIGVVYVIRAVMSARWPSVEGRILQSGNEPGDQMLVVYEYEVDGKRFEGSRIFSAPLAPADRSEIRKYEEGARVRVFYSERRPGSAYLERSPLLPALLLCAIGIVAACSSAFM